MSTFTAALADVRIRVTADAAAERWLADYLVTDSAADAEAAVHECDPPPHLALHRALTEALLPFDTVLMHASAVSAGGTAYLFTAPSGTGKSTHARLWRQLLASDAVMINDDKPYLRLTPAGVRVYGSPWRGKHRLGANISAPLGGICVLSQAPVNEIVRLSPREAYPLLFRQIYRPQDAAMLAHTLRLLDVIADSIPLYALRCTADISAAELSLRTLKGSTK